MPSVRQRVENLEAVAGEDIDDWGGQMLGMPPMARSAVRRLVMAIVIRGSTLPIVTTADLRALADEAAATGATDQPPKPFEPAPWQGPWQ